MPNIVKNTTIINLFDLLAAHSCRGCGTLGQPLCDRCKNYIIKQHNNFCPICQQPTPLGNCPNCLALPPIFIAGHREDLLGDLIHDYKFNSIRTLANPLAEILDHTLPNNDRLLSMFTASTPNFAIVPLPTITKHRRERGFDHTLLIAKQLAKIRHYKVQNLLARAHNTVQVGSDRNQRLIQASSAYSLKSNTVINKNSIYILLDDVWTTGASVQAVYSLLHQAGAKNIVLALLARSGA